MHIKLNNEVIMLPDEDITISDLLKMRNIDENGIAVAINGRLAKRPGWSNTLLKENDDIVFISAAFGG